MKPVEDEEESVDAIAAELEKSDPEKKAGVKSPKKGPKKGPKKEGDKEEDDVDVWMPFTAIRKVWQL